MKRCHPETWAVLSGLFLALMAGPGSANAATPVVDVLVASTTVEGTPSGTISAGLFTIGTDAPAGGLSWSNVIVGSTTHHVANQYLRLGNTYNGANFGVRLYTDNMDTVTAVPAANPKYTGTPSNSNPKNLVNAASTASTIAMSWHVQLSTAITPGEHIVGQGTSGDFSWFFMKDAAQLNFSTPDSISYETVLTADGIHYAQGPDQFGPNNPPDASGEEVCYLYFGLAQRSLAAGATYSTNKITVELYTL